MEKDKYSAHKGMPVLADEQTFIGILNSTEKRGFRQVQEFLNQDEVQVVRAMDEALNRHQDLIESLRAKDEQLLKYAGIMVLLPMCELHARGRVDYILSTTVEEDELVSLLTSLHRDIKQIVDDYLYPGQSLPDEVEDFRLDESRRFVQLLKELKLLIIQKGKIDIEKDNHADVDEAKQQTPLEKEIKVSTIPNISSKQDQIIVSSDWIEPVFEGLKLFIVTEQWNPLKELLHHGYSRERIRFYGKQNILVDLFSRLYSNGHLTGAGSQEALARWLSKNFFYKKGEKFFEVSPKGAIQIISKFQNIPPNHERLCLREGLKDLVSSKKRVSRT